MRGWFRFGVLFSLALSGCFGGQDEGGDEYRDPYMDEPLPPSCKDTSTGPCDTEAAPDADACEGSSDCADGQVCVGEFDGERTPFACVATCVANHDDAAWCTDDAGCCDANATCSPRGYCLPS